MSTSRIVLSISSSAEILFLATLRLIISRSHRTIKFSSGRSLLAVLRLKQSESHIRFSSSVPQFLSLDSCLLSLKASLRAATSSSVDRLRLYLWFAEHSLFSILNSRCSNFVTTVISQAFHPMILFFYKSLCEVFFVFHSRLLFLWTLQFWSYFVCINYQCSMCLPKFDVSKLSSNFGFRQTDRRTDGRMDALNILWAFLVKN